MTRSPEQKLNERVKNPDLKVLSGSRLYGTHDPESDYDYRGFLVPPKEYRLGIYNKGGTVYGFEQHDVNNDEEGDVTIYSLRKFLKLLLKGNSFCLELLFTDEEHVCNVTLFGKKVMDNKEKFFSKKMMKPFSGFAWGSFKKAEARENPKDAYHAMRVLSEGVEFFKTNHITLPRPKQEREFLHAVKNNNVSLGVIKDEFEKRDKKLKEAFDNSSLPDKPNYSFVNELILETHS